MRDELLISACRNCAHQGRELAFCFDRWNEYGGYISEMGLCCCHEKEYDWGDMLKSGFNGCDDCEDCEYFHPELIECIFIEEIIQQQKSI